MGKYILFPFADAGDTIAVPDETQGSGAVSYQQGYGPQYSLDIETEPTARRIQRGPFNQIMNDVTGNIRDWQLVAYPDYVTPAENDGTAVPYRQGMIVNFNNSYRISLVANNTSAPTDNTNWANAFPLPIALGGTGQTSAAGIRNALSLGTAALLDTGTSSGNIPTVSQANSLYLKQSSNLSDLDNLPTARNNLGLGNVATLDVGTSLATNVLRRQDGDGRYLQLSGGTLTDTLTVRQNGAGLILQQEGNGESDSAFVAIRRLDNTVLGTLGSTSLDIDDIRITANVGNVRLVAGSNQVLMDNPHSASAQGSAGSALTRRDWVAGNFLGLGGGTLTGNLTVDRSSADVVLGLHAGSNFDTRIEMTESAQEHGVILNYDGDVNAFQIITRDSNVDTVAMQFGRASTTPILVSRNTLIDNGESTDLTIRSNDDGISRIAVHGANQGTGEVFIGQSASVGFILRYNGDDQPDLAGETDALSIISTFGNPVEQVLSIPVQTGDIVVNRGVRINDDLELRNDSGTSTIRLGSFSTANVDSQIQFRETSQNGFNVIYRGSSDNALAFQRILNNSLSTVATINRDSGLFEIFNQLSVNDDNGSTPLLVTRSSDTNINMAFRDTSDSSDLYFGRTSMGFAFGTNANLSDPANRYLVIENTGVFQTAAQNTSSNALTRVDYVQENFSSREGQQRILSVSSSTGDNFIFLGALRADAGDTDGYLAFTIHKDVDQGQENEPGYTSGYVNQRNGTLHGNAFRLGGTEAISSGNEISVRAYRNGDVINVYLFMSDFASVSLQLTGVSFNFAPSIIDQASITATSTTVPAGSVAFDSFNTAFDLEQASIPAGVPIPWPRTTPPAGYLECRGQTFNTSQYPRLLAAYPSGRLPELRGEFIRGWDNGRNVDTGRSILSTQADAFREHDHAAFATTSVGTDTGSAQQVANDVGGRTGQTGASETRPRNVAFMYIVRAA